MEDNEHKDFMLDLKDHKMNDMEAEINELKKQLAEMKDKLLKKPNTPLKISADITLKATPAGPAGNFA